MKILVVGSGGREHAIAWRLAQDKEGHELYCAPGNAGTAAIATNVAVAAEDIDGVVAWATANHPDLVVVGPEAPLVKGLVDALQKIGVPAFGPVAAGARMEGSKRFAKEVMDAAGVPTGKAEVFTDAAAAKASLPSFGLPVVIKADGLAAGKGVIVAETAEQAEGAIDDMLVGNKFGAAGAEVLIEEFLHGEECSILALVDGENAVLLPSSQDHKRVFDGDKGPNTGGMGAYSPAPVVTADRLPEIKEKIILLSCASSRSAASSTVASFTRGLWSTTRIPIRTGLLRRAALPSMSWSSTRALATPRPRPFSRGSADLLRLRFSTRRLAISRTRMSS